MKRAIVMDNNDGSNKASDYMLIKATAQHHSADLI